MILAGAFRDTAGEASAMADDAFDVLFEHGLLIQPLSIERGSLEDPDSHPFCHLTHGMAVDGIRL